MNKQTNIIATFLILASLLFVPALFYSCTEEEDEQIFIEYRFPESIKLGTKDTLYFKIKSLHSIDTVKVKESEIVYVEFNNRTFGADCYKWEVYLLYNPATPGNKALEFWVKAGGIYIKKHPFSINVK